MWKQSGILFILSMNGVGFFFILIGIWLNWKKERTTTAPEIGQAQEALEMATEEAAEVLEELKDFNVYMMRQMENKHKELILLYQLIDEKQTQVHSIPDPEQKPVAPPKDLLPLSTEQEEILVLYREGKTVDEIAKKMQMGKGEVQLVIGLFQMR